MRSVSSRAGRAVLLVAMVALSACSEHTNPTPTAPNLQASTNLQSPRLPIADDDGGGDEVDPPPVISSLSLSSTTLTINGPSVNYSATISNPGLYPNLSVVGYLIQGTLQRTVTQKALSCGTTCTVTGTIAASNLSPGSATFRLQLLDATGSAVNTKNVLVTLVSALTISNLSLSSTTAAIGGPLVPYTVTIQNSGSSVSGMGIQGFVTQGTLRQPAGGTALVCGSGTGVLPTGTCVVSFTYGASSGSGLVPGAATFELELKQNGAVIGKKSVAITLVSATTISAVNLSSTTAAIGGPLVPYTATIQNVGSSVSGMGIQGFVTQGTLRQPAGGTALVCGSGTGVLPTGTCVVSFTYGATNGSGLVPGAAIFELELKRDGAVIERKSVAITLVSAVTISALNLSSTTAVIEGAHVPYTVTIQNVGPSVSGMGIQGVIKQGTARRAANGTALLCGSGTGVLPNGTCEISFEYRASNSGSGFGTLVPGAATFELELNQNGAVIEKKSVAITLVAAAIQ